MKFVYFGYDFMLPAIEAALNEGHELLGIFSFECDNVFNFNTRCQDLSARLGIPFKTEHPDQDALNEYCEKGTGIFLSAGYPYKIPPIDEANTYAINIHPTYLPVGRGLMPIPKIIIEDIKEAAGFTAHKMTQDFDAGDILLQEKFDLSPQETVETYSAKIAMRAPDMVSALLTDTGKLWADAKPQDPEKARYFAPVKDIMRFFDFTQSVQDIDRIGRAFGRFGSLIRMDDKNWVIYDYSVWEEQHDYAPGTVVAQLSREITIAAKDGFVCLKDFQPVE